MGWPVMIFAAGFGTRMKHLTRDRPKPLLDIGDLAKLERWQQLGVNRPVFGVQSFDRQLLQNPT